MPKFKQAEALNMVMGMESELDKTRTGVISYEQFKLYIMRVKGIVDRHAINSYRDLFLAYGFIRRDPVFNDVYIVYKDTDYYKAVVRGEGTLPHQKQLGSFVEDDINGKER